MLFPDVTFIFISSWKISLSWQSLHRVSSLYIHLHRFCSHISLLYRLLSTLFCFAHVCYITFLYHSLMDKFTHTFFTFTHFFLSFTYLLFSIYISQTCFFITLTFLSAHSAASISLSAWVHTHPTHLSYVFFPLHSKASGRIWISFSGSHSAWVNNKKKCHANHTVFLRLGKSHWVTSE